MIPFSYNNNAVEYTVGFGYFGILSNLSAASIRIESNSNRTHRRISCLVRKCFLLGYADATSISPELLTFYPGDCMMVDVERMELIGNEPPPSDYSLTWED